MARYSDPSACAAAQKVAYIKITNMFEFAHWSKIQSNPQPANENGYFSTTMRVLLKAVQKSDNGRTISREELMSS